MMQTAHWYWPPSHEPMHSKAESIDALFIAVVEGGVLDGTLAALQILLALLQ